jgi:DNA-directed RNA polymerase subunit M
MIFCPNCGSILIPKKKDNKVVIRCSCGYLLDKEQPLKLKEVISQQKRIEAVEEEFEIHPLTHDSECPKCGNKAAYYWEVQTRASDEPATKFLKCEKCKHIWRDYK